MKFLIRLWWRWKYRREIAAWEPKLIKPVISCDLATEFAARGTVRFEVNGSVTLSATFTDTPSVSPVARESFIGMWGRGGRSIIGVLSSLRID